MIWPLASVRAYMDGLDIDGASTAADRPRETLWATDATAELPEDCSHP
jgi:hypothetical protein